MFHRVTQQTRRNTINMTTKTKPTILLDTINSSSSHHHPLSTSSPLSFSSPIVFRNNLTNTLDPLPVPSPDQSRPLSWYSCGPTVYDHSHLGHARYPFPFFTRSFHSLSTD
eukprot:TRINITY_DN2095_c0_g1_i2.p1 TRINITY_DN2095_c0_g1~~TRINITY_DN2095_c0_g1_i2.p1  ORF type:complete len:111 (+),score=15.50 TRINITY_DN2095_c0_g1_i2:209-541(+)